MSIITQYTNRLRDRLDVLPTWVRALGLLLVVALAFYLPYLNVLPFAYIRTDLSATGTDWASVLFLVVVYMIVAVGLNVVIGLAGLLDLGYVGFYALGAYSVALFGSTSSPVVEAIQNKFGLSEEWAVPFAICVPIAIAMALIAGVILGAPTLRLRGDYLAIVTMGFGEIIRICARNLDNVTNGAAGITNVPVPPGPEVDGRPFFNVSEPERWYWLALVVLIILIWMARRLEHSRVGRAWLAIREDEDAAAIMGVAAFKYKLWAFAIGASLGGMAGLLFGSKQQYVEPNGFMLNLSFLFVAMVVIGGSGNILGVLIGAFLLTYLPERFREFQEWRPFAFGVALVAVMILRPQGLVPSRRRAREFEDRKVEAEEAAADV
ncbi:branched-chain amino acid ABC transporter permease [Nocardioides sp. Root122]|jgi:branched-chain amino acid transport system permease protein|uniref:branched-chain amino acid ABC transporter permease n=1 Tax=Nocardioides TaxID=1839 RepID=UPI0007026898|nr:MULTISPECIES: branched-chain amino acid ABC transporter permease [Nocardioides]KQV69770.1 branched-chain amino acid ABC transporter permease [Nocardioides sp. Root122]MCK9823026.1 branched-chain amino acid ABC transporter permease [Nocardioides cavernae]